jgi:hypothetical protein
VTSSQPEGDPATRPEVTYAEAVRQDIREHGAYFARRITLYRQGRVIVIISAALVPVLATATAVPRWVLGVFGALAAVTEGIQAVYQLRASALSAMRTANALERVLNKYMTGVAPYDGPADRAFPAFASDVEKIRETADEAFLQTWQGAVAPPGQDATG